jgi:uncharacterized membrane protein
MAQNMTGKPMNNADSIWATIGKNLPPIVGNWWLWLANHELAWWVSLGTLLYIASQLFWGWMKYFRGGYADDEL